MCDLSILPPGFQPYKSYLQKSGQLERIYRALQHNDIAEPVLMTMDVFSQSPELKLRQEQKSETKSDKLRNEGNKYYKKKKFRKALERYNQALLYAPENSKAMRLAFGNRSALLFTIDAFSFSLKDIEKVFSMGFPDDDLTTRLIHRKNECMRLAPKEEDMHQFFYSSFGEKFFTFDVKRHPEINCASSTDVKIEMEDGLPKVVAARHIPVGTIVAIDTPFVSELEENGKFWLSCYYCLRLTVNLIPCDGCCYAMFCSETCKIKCKQEFHAIECKIMTCMKETYIGPGASMKMKAVLKMRQMCKSWNELIEASKTIGENRMRVSSLQEIYNGSHEFSLLNYRDPGMNFLHGEQFGAVVGEAVKLHNLLQVPDYFPEDTEECKEAVRALARMMMSLYLFLPKIDVRNSALDVYLKTKVTQAEIPFAWYPFAGKLRHCCDCNLENIFLNNQVALVACAPIKKGKELTISYIGHFMDRVADNRPLLLYKAIHRSCNCQVCVENWHPGHLREVEDFNFDQDEAYDHWVSVYKNKSISKDDKLLYDATINGLDALYDVRGCGPYYDVFDEFRTIMSMCQYNTTRNTFITDNLQLRIVRIQ